MDLILIAVLLILSIIVLILVFPIIYKIFTGQNANLVCKEAAGQAKFNALLGVALPIAPFVPLCDIFVPNL